MLRKCSAIPAPYLLHCLGVAVAATHTLHRCSQHVERCLQGALAQVPAGSGAAARR